MSLEPCVAGGPAAPRRGAAACGACRRRGTQAPERPALRGGCERASERRSANMARRPEQSACWVLRPEWALGAKAQQGAHSRECSLAACPAPPAPPARRCATRGRAPCRGRSWRGATGAARARRRPRGPPPPGARCRAAAGDTSAAPAAGAARGGSPRGRTTPGRSAGKGLEGWPRAVGAWQRGRGQRRQEVGGRAEGSGGMARRGQRRGGECPAWVAAQRAHGTGVPHASLGPDGAVGGGMLDTLLRHRCHSTCSAPGARGGSAAGPAGWRPRRARRPRRAPSALRTSHPARRTARAGGPRQGRPLRRGCGSGRRA